MGDNMISKKIQVKSKHGLHLRPATELIKLSSQYEGEIVIIKNGIEVNGKSILGILSLGIEKKDWIIVKVEGDNEGNFLKLLDDFFSKEE